jgi:hypothetical protein
MNDSVCAISTGFILYVFKHKIMMIVWNNFLSFVTIYDHLCGQWSGFLATDPEVRVPLRALPSFSEK